MKQVAYPLAIFIYKADILFDSESHTVLAVYFSGYYKFTLWVVPSFRCFIFSVYLLESFVTG